MKRTILYFLFILYNFDNLYSSDITLESVRTINGSAGASDYCMNTSSTPDGGTISSGYSSDGLSAFAVLIKYDAAGVRQWLKTFRNSDNGIDYFSKILVDNSGNIYASGGSLNGSSNQDILIQKYSSAGTLIWTTLINSHSNNNDYPVNFKNDNQGNLILVFNEQTGSSHINAAKLDVNGNILWHYRMADSTATAYSFDTDESNNIYIAGTKYREMYASVEYMIKLNSSGNVNWKKSGDYLNFREYSFSNIKVTGINEVYALSKKYGENLEYIAANKIDSSGNLLWTKDIRINIKGEMSAKALESDSSGNIYFISSVKPIVTENNGQFLPGYYMGKFSPSGDSLWSRLLFNNDIYSGDDAYMKLNSSNDLFVLCYLREGKQVAKIIKFSSAGDSVSSGNFYYSGSYGGILSLSVNILGNPVASGSLNQKYNENDYFLKTFNENCQNVWENKYDSRGFSKDFGSNLIEDNYGNIYVAGANNREAYLVKYNSSMTELWRYVLNDSDGFDPHYNYVPLIAKDNSGNVYISYSISGNNSDNDILISKIDSSGNKIFSILISGQNNSKDFLTAITTDENDNMYLSGYYYTQSTQAFIAKYSHEGLLSWIRDSEPAIYSKINVKDKYIYLMGGNLTKKLTTSGIVIWENIYQPNNYVNTFYDFKLDKNENLIACGMGVKENESENYIIVKYDRNGVMKWYKYYNGLRNSSDEATSVAVDTLNNIIVSGNAKEFTGSFAGAVTTLKLDTTGNIIWKKLISDINSYKIPAGKVILDKYDNVYISSGYGSYISLAYQYMLVKYRSNGDSIWSVVYNNPRFPNSSYDFIITRDQNLIMTGTAYGINTGYDITTLKYSQTSGISNNPVSGFLSYSLLQNFPNPFNPNTIISYQLPMLNEVRLIVYDVLGKEVLTLVNEKQNAGYYKVEFEGSNFPSGVYFYKLEAGSFNEVKRMILLK